MSPPGLPAGSLACLIAFGSHASAAPPIDFQREVQPILAEHRAHCHRIDAKQRQARLRLDTRNGAMKGGSSGAPAVVPRQPEKSELYLRITSHNADAVMTRRTSRSR